MIRKTDVMIANMATGMMKYACIKVRNTPGMIGVICILAGPTLCNFIIL